VTALVTGGTGFLGAEVVAQLAARGARPRVLVRGTYEPRFEGEAARAVEVVKGDLAEGTDDQLARGEIDPLVRALDGCDEVYHLAGQVSRDPGAAAGMMRVHVDGTARLLRAARAAGVRRMVVASSSGTIAVAREPEPVPTEAWPFATELVSGWPYYLSKIYQEKVALDLGARLGVEVVLVNPSLLLGPGDRRLSSTGDVLRFLRRQIPVVPSGGLSLVDVRDAAAATIAAMDGGRAWERYLLGGPNWSFAEFFGRLARTSKVPAPRLRLPDRWARAGASLVEELARRAGREPTVDRISVEMGQVYWYCDSARATRELGFAARDPGETLDATVRYLRRTQRV
jgi:dihydroflavonol-4-reductase